MRPIFGPMSSMGIDALGQIVTGEMPDVRADKISATDLTRPT